MEVWQCGNLVSWYTALMPYDLGWRPEADEAMTTLEADPSKTAVVEAIDRTLMRMEADPFDPRLGTIPFRSPELGGVYATPIRLDDWYILWQRGSGTRELVIILIHQLNVG